VRATKCGATVPPTLSSISWNSHTTMPGTPSLRCGSLKLEPATFAVCALPFDLCKGGRANKEGALAAKMFVGAIGVFELAAKDSAPHGDGSFGSAGGLGRYSLYRPRLRILELHYYPLATTRPSYGGLQAILSWSRTEDE
jgi:hypothetical protein